MSDVELERAPRPRAGRTWCLLTSLVLTACGGSTGGRASPPFGDASAPDGSVPPTDGPAPRQSCCESPTPEGSSGSGSIDSPASPPERREAPCGPGGWPRVLGGPGAQWLADFSVSEQDAVWLAGSYRGGADLGCGTPLQGDGTFVARLDGRGATTFAGEAAGRALHLSAVESTPDGGAIVAGVFSGPFTLGSTQIGEGPVTRGIILVSLAPSGAVRWTRTFAHSVGLADVDLRVASGALLIAGAFEGTLDFDQAGVVVDPPRTTPGRQRTLFVARLDADGTPQWARAFTGEFPAQLSDLALSRSGTAFIAGAQRDWPSGAEPTACGSLPATFVLALDARGECVYLADAGGTNGALALAAGPEETLLVAGARRRDAQFNDVLVRSLDAKGAFVWETVVPFAGSAEGYGIELQESGDQLVVWGASTNPFDYSSMGTPLAVLSQSGEVHHQTLVRAAPMNGLRAAFAGPDDLIVAGAFGGTIQLGLNELVAEGDADVVVAHLAPSSW